jgi:hypothetical protein
MRGETTRTERSSRAMARRADHAGRDREARVAFEGDNLGARPADAGEEFLLGRKSVGAGTALQTATEESPCSPITWTWTERGSTRGFSPSSERRRKVSIKVPEPTTLPKGSPDSFWATKVRMSTGLVATRRGAGEILGHEFPDA